MKSKLLIFPLLLLLLIPFARAEEVEVTARVNANRITVNDLLIFTLSFKGITKPSKPDLSGFSDFKIIQSYEGSSFTMINGVASYYTNLNYYLKPQKKGILTIPAVTYNHEGKTYKTRQFKIQVIDASKGGTSLPRRKKSIFDFDDDFFKDSPFSRGRRKEEVIDVRLKPVISKKNPFKGEQIIYKILLITRNRISSINPVSNPSFNGFWHEPFPNSKTIDGKSEMIDGKRYQIYEIRKAGLFPTKAGKLIIPSLKFEMLIQMYSFSFIADTKRIYRSTPKIEIDVQELPDNSDLLPVGDFKFRVYPQKREIDINDILTITIAITGRGNLKTVDPPHLKNNDFYRVYPAKIRRNTSFRNNSIHGEIKAEIPISFLKPGIISFNRFKFKYFNPELGKVINLDSNEFNVKVTGSRTEGRLHDSNTVVNKRMIRKEGEDINFIEKGTIYKQNRHIYKSSLFFILIIVPFLLNLIYLLKVLLYDHLLVNSSSFNMLKIYNKTVKALEAVKSYKNISPILEGYLNAKLKIGFSSMSTRQVEEIFIKSGVNDFDIKQFVNIKLKSDSARFSPEKEDAKMLQKDIQIILCILKRVNKKLK
jgi:hypothetical protein